MNPTLSDFVWVLGVYATAVGGIFTAIYCVRWIAQKEIPDWILSVLGKVFSGPVISVVALVAGIVCLVLTR